MLLIHFIMYFYLPHIDWKNHLIGLIITKSDDCKAVDVSTCTPITKPYEVCQRLFSQ